MHKITKPLMLLSFFFVCSLIAFWPIRAATEHSLMVLHLAMLYIAAAILMLSFTDSLFKWWYAIFPIIPNILSYTKLNSHEVGFAYSYLLAAAILSYVLINKAAKYKYFILLLAILLLAYGTSVKIKTHHIALQPSKLQITPEVTKEVNPVKYVVDHELAKASPKEQVEIKGLWSATVLQRPLIIVQEKIKNWAYNLKFSGIFVAIHTALQFIWLSPLLVLYVCLGLLKRRETDYALPLLLFTFMNVMILSVLVFCNVASTASYMFMCVCLLHASHGFAHRCWLSTKQNNLTSYQK